MQIELTKEELFFLHRKVAQEALCYLQHAAQGGLSASETEHKDFLVTLSDKFAEAGGATTGVPAP